MVVRIVAQPEDVLVLLLTPVRVVEPVGSVEVLFSADGYVHKAENRSRGNLVFIQRFSTIRVSYKLAMASSSRPDTTFCSFCIIKIPLLG
jgi:hypothetical protein